MCLIFMSLQISLLREVFIAANDIAEVQAAFVYPLLVLP